MKLCNKNEIECKNACSYENYEHREILQNVSEKGTQLRTLRKFRKYRFFFRKNGKWYNYDGTLLDAPALLASRSHSVGRDAA